LLVAATKCSSIRVPPGRRTTARRLGVGHRFLRREGLARDDEERLGGDGAGEHRGQVGAVDIGDEVERQARMRDVRQGANDHLRAEIAAADADVDDVTQARRCGRGRRGRRRHVGAPAHRFRKGEHRVEDAVDLVAGRTFAARRAQRRVENGAALGRVDHGAREHRVALRLDAALAREVGEKAHRRRVDEVLRQVGEQARRLERQGLEATRIARERFAQVEVAAVRLVVAGERGPGGGAVAARRRDEPGRASSLIAAPGRAIARPAARLRSDRCESTRRHGATAGRRSRTCRCADLLGRAANAGHRRSPERRRQADPAHAGASSVARSHDLPFMPTMKLTGRVTAAQTARTASRSGSAGANRTSAPAASYAFRRAIVSARSGGRERSSRRAR
jgi:hypothetical protein